MEKASETVWKTTVVENSNEFEIRHAILSNNSFLFRKSFIKFSCSYFPCICLLQGDQIILQWQHISNSNDFLWHVFTGYIGMSLVTGKSSNLFFSSTSIAWFRIKDCLKVISDIFYNAWQTEQKLWQIDHSHNHYFVAVMARHLPQF